MRSTSEHRAWNWFRRMMDNAERGACDGCVPVALLVLPSMREPSPEGCYDIDMNGEVRIVWPNSFPLEARGPLLARCAESYQKGTVR